MIVKFMYSVNVSDGDGYLRIGELSRRAGVRPELLRAWERRYGLLSPSRSPGGFRLYSDDDERRVQAMRAYLARGLSAAQAARLALAASEFDGAPAAGRAAAALDDARADLRDALDRYDDARAHRAIDDLLAAYSVETVLGRIVLPYLAELGERWSRGEVSVAQEHYASHLLRGRLLGLARGWGHGAGPRAVLACVPGEQHDLALIVFGLSLRSRGWRVTFLGPDTPVETLEGAAESLSPDLVVVAASTPDALRRSAGELRRLARRWPLAIGGRAVAHEALAAIGARALAGGPIDEADRLACGA